MKTKAFWTTALLSLLTFLVTCWSAINADSTPYWVESIACFMLTYFCIDHFSKKTNGSDSTLIIGAAVTVGLLVVQLPCWIMDFSGCVGSMMIFVGCVLATVLAIICWRNTKISSFVAAYVVLALYNSLVPGYWDELVKSLH